MSTRARRTEGGLRVRTWLRHLTAALMLAILAGLAVIGIQRSQRLTGTVSDVVPTEVVGGDDPAVGVYTGFEFIESVAGKAIFALRSIRTLGKSSGWHEIEGVQLQLYEDGERGPVVTAEGASFNIQTRDARLRGPIRITFPGGATVSTTGGSFEAATRTFTSSSDVLLMNGETLARAGRVTYEVRGSRVVLEDDSVVTSGGTSLFADRVEYLRRQGRVLFPVGCTIVRGRGRIEAPRATMTLDESDGSPDRISLEGGVAISDPGNAEGGGFTAWAEQLVARRDSSGNWQVLATTDATWITLTLGPAGDMLERKIQTQRMVAVVAPEGLLSLRTMLVTCLRDVPLEGDIRTAESREARAWFTDGVATDLEMVGSVDISGQGIRARGARARLVSGSGIAMLYGDPQGDTRALVESDRGRVSSDQVQIFDREQRIEARGDVQGQLEGVAILGADDGAGRQPMNFAAGVLDITENGEHYRLREGARVWQGQRLLIADDVSYRQRTQTVEAAGHVRATFPADQLASGSDSGDDVVVVSRSLRYDRPGRQAIFTGNVRYSDPDHVLSATELRASFDAEDTITQIEATGDVQIEQLATGRRLEAQQAIRDVTVGVIHATGSPVRLTDATGTSVSSSSLTWNEADGSVTVAGGTETVYYPEEEP